MKLIYLLALVVMTTVANVVSENIPKCSIWHPMGRIPDETDCTRYYQCIFAIPRLTFCPKLLDKQTYFYPTLELCLWSETSPCKNPSTSPDPEPGTSPDPEPGTSADPITPTEPTTTPKSDADRCKNYFVPDPPTKPDDCEKYPCNGPMKGECQKYYKWDGTDKILASCPQGTYYNSIVQQCDNRACPPCITTPPPL